MKKVKRFWKGHLTIFKFAVKIFYSHTDVITSSNNNFYMEQFLTYFE